MTELTIKTPEDWWNLLNKNIDNIKKLISLNYHYSDHWSDNWQGDDYPPNAITFNELEDLINRKEVVRLVTLFNHIWWCTPENICREQPGWFALCDLCSECWVHPEFEPPDIGVCGIE